MTAIGDQSPSRSIARTCKGCDRGWELNGLEYGYFTATHPDFDASYEGPEDGWVGSHPTLQGRTPEDLRAEIDAWCEENPV